MMIKRVENLFKACCLLAITLILIQSGFVLALFAIYGIWRSTQKPVQHFTVWIFSGTLVVSILFIFLIHPPLTSDFQTLFQTARDILAHNFSYQRSAYFSLWAYQTAFVIWEAFWLSLWDNPICLELVGAVLTAGVTSLLYRLSRQWVGERSAQAASLLLAIFPFFITFHTLLSNQIPSAFFLTLALWLLVCTDCDHLGFLRFPLAGLALQAGNLLRNEGVIFLTAILTWFVFHILRHPKEIRRIGTGMIVLLTIYFSVYAGVAVLVRISGLNSYGLQNGNPLWKFVTGLSYESQGGYSDEDWSRISVTLDEDYQRTPETDELQKQMIIERLTEEPSIMIRHIRNKLRGQWISDGLSWVFADFSLQHPFCYGLIKQFDRGIFLIALNLFAYGLSDKKRWENRPQAARLPYFIFFAAFFAFLIVEVQPRYAYLPQLYVFTGAAFGIERLREEKNHA